MYTLSRLHFLIGRRDHLHDKRCLTIGNQLMLQKIPHHGLYHRILRILFDFAQHILIDKILHRHLHDADKTAKPAARLYDKAFVVRETGIQYIADLRWCTGNLIGNIRSSELHLPILLRCQLPQDIFFD